MGIATYMLKESALGSPHLAQIWVMRHPEPRRLPRVLSRIYFGSVVTPMAMQMNYNRTILGTELRA